MRKLYETRWAAHRNKGLKEGRVTLRGENTTN